MLDTSLNQALHQCVGNQQSLPADCYTSEGFLSIELQACFNAGWLCVGREDEIPDVGDYFTTTLLNQPLLIVRKSPKQVAVHANVCRHRAMPVASGAGNTRRFVCPYHAWTYKLNGSLQAAPLMSDKASLKDCRLPSIRTECWQGFIMVNFNNDAQPLAPQLCDLDAVIGNYQPATMHHIASFTEVWDCNWKSLTENFMDAYHLSVVHPQSLRPLTPTHLCDTLAQGPAFTSYIANYASAAPPRECHASTLSDEQTRQSRLFCVYPAMVASVSPDTLVYLSLQPVGTAQVEVKWGISVFEADLPEQQRAQRIAKWQQINHEDHEILRGLQAGLRSSFYASGTLAPAQLEGCISDFHRYLMHSIDEYSSKAASDHESQ